MTKQKKILQYTEDSIKVLKGLEQVRKRPSLYLGERGSNMLWRMLKEPVENCGDEALAKRNNYIEVYIDTNNNEYLIRDKAQGIPVGIHPTEKISTLQVVMTTLHAGGKFDSDTYKVSAGCFVGSTGIHLSKRLNCTFEQLYKIWLTDRTPIAVQSLNIDTNTVVPGEIYHVQLSKYVNELTEIHLSNGSIIQSTVDHPYYLQDCTKVEAQNLAVGDSLNENIDELLIVTHTKKIIVDNVPVYGISVRGEHNYMLEAGCFVGNTHGIGISATNALSDTLKVWTFRDGECWHQEYLKGKPKAKVAKAKVEAAVFKKFVDKTKQGTIIQYFPDHSIISKDLESDAIIDRNQCLSWLRDFAMLNKNLLINVTFNGKQYSFINKFGPELLLKRIEKKLTVKCIGKSFLFESENFTCALAFSDKTDVEGLFSYVCNAPTKSGGTHVIGMNNAIIKSLTAHTLKKDKFNNRDLLEGLIGVIHWRMSEPEFPTQIKDMLSSNISKEVEALLTPALIEFFAKNKKLARMIIKHAVHLTSSREQYKKVLKSIGEMKKASNKTLLPTILASAIKARPEDRELFLCEGDSAYNSCKLARDAAFQEVMKAKGKPINAMRESIERVLANEEIQNLIIALGVDIEKTKKKKQFSVEGLRVQNMFLLADADSDGPLRGDTVVLTVDGRNPTMLQLSIEWTATKCPTLVYAYDAKGNLIETEALACRVYDTVTRMCVIETTDGTKIHCTQYHKFVTTKSDARTIPYLGNSYIKASDLEVGDYIMASRNNGTSQEGTIPACVKHISVIDCDPTDMYCLTVPETGNFMIADNYGNGICSANCHINLLFLAFFYKFMPDLIKQNRVFVVDAPLFHAFYKNKRYIGSTFEACYKQMPKGSPKNVIIRSKGYGEISPETLAIVAFHPDTRGLIAITYPQTKELLERYELIVSDETLTRKSILGLL